MTIARRCPGNPKLALLTEHDLKKQSQFEPAQMNVSFVARKDYENRRALRLGQNKAKQSQSNPMPKQLTRFKNNLRNGLFVAVWGGKSSMAYAVCLMGIIRRHIVRTWISINTASEKAEAQQLLSDYGEICCPGKPYI